MNLDKNTVIGFSLLALLFFGYFYYTSIGQKEYQLQQMKVQDSLKKIEQAQQSIQGTTPIDKKNKTGENANKNVKKKEEKIIAEEFTTIETSLIKVKLSNKGGTLTDLKLKQTASFLKSEIDLIVDNSTSLNYSIKEKDNIIESKNLFFEKPTITTAADGTQTIEYIYNTANGIFLKHIYTFKPNDYLFDFKISSNNFKALFGENQLKAVWLSKLKQQEPNSNYEKTQSQLSYLTTKGNFDYESLANGVSENIEDPVKWISIKQQFFNNTLISTNTLNQVKNNSEIINDTTNKFFLKSKTDFSLNIDESNSTIAFKYYFGPTEYKELKKYNLELERIMNIGQGFYSFVKYINKGVVIPIFNFLKSNIANFGIVILLLTIFLRIITAPLLYTSYLSSAKMKLLKPELDELKKKTDGDQQAFAMKQMELYRSAGVNPLGGCIPALLQIPIFLSLYYFFNSCIDLRGQSFLWATDLSTFDSIYTLSFNIPVYGNHISLFTILNVITSFLISYFGMQSAPDQGNPMLKYMPYIFPIVLLGFFNSLPSALTWYYTVSNIITLLLQLIIQKYIINHDKLLRQIEEKRKQPKKKTAWMQKIEQMQNTRKKIDEMKNKK